MTTARLLVYLLLFTADRNNDGGIPVRLPAAQAFTPQTLGDRASLPKFHLQEATRNRRSLRRRKRSYPSAPADDANDSRLRPKVSSSDDDSLNSSTATGENATKRFFLPLTAFVTLSLVTLAALTNHLPGTPIDATAPPPFFATLPYGVFFSGSCDPYSVSLITRDVSSTVFSIAAAATFVKGITYPAKMGFIESRDSRKLIHTLSAPLFLLVWPLFSNAYGARVFASIVPLLNAVRLYVAGTGGSTSSSDPNLNSGDSSENELAGAISRSGDVKEALGGPFIYVVVLFISTLFFWTDSPIGIVSVATMAVGDGLADLIGRRYGSLNKWFFNKSKSMAGSAAFVAGSFVGSYGLISWLTSMGAMDPLALETTGLALRLFAIAVICAGVELIPHWSTNRLFACELVQCYCINRKLYV